MDLFFTNRTQVYFLNIEILLPYLRLDCAHQTITKQHMIVLPNSIIILLCMRMADVVFANLSILFIRKCKMMKKMKNSFQEDTLSGTT